FSRDWSSDVCSSDLVLEADLLLAVDLPDVDAQDELESCLVRENVIEGSVETVVVVRRLAVVQLGVQVDVTGVGEDDDRVFGGVRSEERRVGKEGRQE